MGIRILLCILMHLSLGAFAEAAVVDLHAHPFMKEGMGMLFSGDFGDEELRAKDWTAQFENMINETTLEAAPAGGLGLMVVSLYGHPIFGGNARESVRRQLKAAKAYVARSKAWALATSPAEARAAVAAGKGVLILGLEGAAGVIDSEDDLKEFIDEGGIRIVTLLHLTDDHLGGAAFLKGLKAIFTPVAFLTQLFDPLRGEDGVRLNRNGLSVEGYKLAVELMKRRVWVDLAHSSDQAQKRLVPLLSQAGRPLLYTHTMLRRYYGAERAISDEQLAAVGRSRGVVGLIPSEEMMVGTKGLTSVCPASCNGSCAEGIFALAVQFREVARQLGARSVVFGTDLNGGLKHMRPVKTCPLGEGWDTEGLWHVGHMGRLQSALVKLGVVNQETADSWVPEFLGAWARLWDAPVEVKP